MKKWVNHPVLHPDFQMARKVWSPWIRSENLPGICLSVSETETTTNKQLSVEEYAKSTLLIKNETLLYKIGQIVLTFLNLPAFPSYILQT